MPLLFEKEKGTAVVNPKKNLMIPGNVWTFYLL